MLGHRLAKYMAAFLIVGASLSASSAYAYDAGDWVIRARAIYIEPQETTSVITVNGAAVAGSGVTVDNDYQPELDITYMFTKNWGAELILGQSQHDVDGKGTLSGLNSIIDLHLLPPTLTLQYHFLPDNNIRPYVGIGVNYVHPFDEEVTGGLAAPGARVDVDDSLGFALQVGVDVDITKDWFLNFDLKYLDVETTARFTNTAVSANNDVTVDINPIVVGIGIGTTF